MTTEVAKPSAAIVSLAHNWRVIEALLGGTPAMRAAGEFLLPKWPAEEPDHWKARLNTATLFPAYRRTVSVMSGKPFSKPVTLSQETPDKILEWCEDIDKEGVNLHSFLAEMTFEAIAYGLCGILVEAPPRKIDSARPQTRAEQAAKGIRPYWVRVKHDQILGWREQIIGGARKIAQLRLLERSVEADGEFGEKEIIRVRVLEPGRWRLYEQDKTDWKLIEEGTTGINEVTFVPLYGHRKSFMIGTPPLLDLAYLNVKHWQSQSDQDTILHVARVPILFAKGFGESEIVVGSATAVKAEMEYADLKFVEHSGASIEAGRQSLVDLEEQMIQSGAELLVAKPGNRTATEDENDAEGNRSDLQRIVETIEDSVDLALDYTAMYASLPTGSKVSIFKDYVARTLSEASAQLVLEMQGRGLITHETALREQQRRGVLSPDIDAKKEATLAKQEGPSLGMLGLNDDEAGDDNEVDDD